MRTKQAQDIGPVTLPAIAALAVNAAGAACLTPDGEIRMLSSAQALYQIHRKPALVCHTPYTRHRLGDNAELQAFDVLELFAFVHPATFCVPTPAGVAKALGLSPPSDFEDYPFKLVEIAETLLGDLAALPSSPPCAGTREQLIAIACAMGLQGKGWVWTPYVCAALGHEYNPEEITVSRTAFATFRALPEWAEEPPPPPPSHHPVTGDESRETLRQLLRAKRAGTEERQAQSDYATILTAAFKPAEISGQPHIVLAEAGTGVGKTLGYLAPASAWAEKNDGAVWISTFTKNLQRQLDQELDAVFPDPEIKKNRVAIRKGRENYLCLLNFEDMANGAALAKSPQQALAAGLIARWISATKDGDINSGDFPGWLSALLGFPYTGALADRRGECVYAACDHYHRCFVERSVRKSNHARIVVANHALVMIQTALSDGADSLPSRYVFDEGHHLFSAADSAFAGHLTGRETRDLRRWLMGAEGRSSRARGLKKRLEDLIATDEDAKALLDAILHAARILPTDGWLQRITEAQPQGALEQFLGAVYQQVQARAEGRNGPYSLETETRPLSEAVSEAAPHLREALDQLRRPMNALAGLLRKRLEDAPEEMDGDTRKRLEGISQSLIRKAETEVGAWISMLATLQEGTSAADYVDWMEIERVEGAPYDTGLYRHWVDPMVPFTAALKPHAHGAVITSATLRDRSGDEERDWDAAREQTGARYLSPEPTQGIYPSPFNYGAQARVYVIGDVRKDDIGQVAGAYRALFEASGGGALGLFTAVQRLRAVHERIAGPLERAGIPVYAQHVDQIDTATLIDIFREETHSCLLGTDALRDGVDVPGQSLRMMVFNRVPWPRPTILHKARRKAFGERRYDEMITRMRLQQAFGRLIRRADDRGVFVMMDSMLPTRLLSAFPDSVEVTRTDLSTAIADIRAFLQSEK